MCKLSVKIKRLDNINNINKCFKYSFGSPLLLCDYFHVNFLMDFLTDLTLGQ